MCTMNATEIQKIMLEKMCIPKKKLSDKTKSWNKSSKKK